MGHLGFDGSVPNPGFYSADLARFRALRLGLGFRGGFGAACLNVALL